MTSLRYIALLVFLCCHVFAQSHELAVGGGYNYQNSDQGNGVRANLHGWFASAQFDLTTWFRSQLKLITTTVTSNARARHLQNHEHILRLLEHALHNASMGRLRRSLP
jgi:hypothetical protein